MKNFWSEKDAKSIARRYASKGVRRDLSHRVYTSRLLGCEPRLVLHGGGNTSVKTTTNDLFGNVVDVLCVKGSGWDMANIEPAGLPAVRLEPLLQLRTLDVLSDEDMVNFQRLNLVDSGSPNPSVETLLHAFLPHKFIDHTHANAVLSITNQRNGRALSREIWGSRMGLVPYIMPGFALAKAAADVYDNDPTVDGLILLNHGIFTFGATAREAYERMIAAVTLAENRLKRRRKRVFVAARLPRTTIPVSEAMPILRGACALSEEDGRFRRMIVKFRTSRKIRNYVDGKDVGRYSQVGVITPDHTIRTKNTPMLLPADATATVENFSVAVGESLEKFVTDYHTYFKRNNKRVSNRKQELDAIPRVVLVPGHGLFGLGMSSAAASIAADIAEATILSISDAEAIGRYACLGEADLFDIEYWSLEQAKLGKGVEAPLARHVVAITGGGSGIGAATAAAFAAQGAEIAVLDTNVASARNVAVAIGGSAMALDCDVTDQASVKKAFAQVCTAFGGVDIVVSNAGAAWQGRVGEVNDAILRQSFELNFFAHQHVAQAAVAVMKAQGTGGVLLFNTSKQAINPGRDFGPYGLPKTATLALMRQYALDHGADGIRANAVNADRIRTGLLSEKMIEARSAARGVEKQSYMSGNLIGREVKAEDVAQAFVHLALARKTTAAVVTVDGGNMAAALR
jgi:rhamnose utilization protein RhaD (predicted bifunctional aldolase and dehydrogenase)/NAD(P)-dependent dehydrogenase (short-subunit alcohol dehydrogenase family)